MKKYREEIGKIHLFIVPDGDISAVSLHMARAVARRTERLAVYVSKKMQVNKYILIYLNRLSSLLLCMHLHRTKGLALRREFGILKEPHRNIIYKLFLKCRPYGFYNNLMSSIFIFWNSPK